MTADISVLHAHRDKLEEAFFCNQDRHLADRLREPTNDDFDPARLAELFGIRDPGSIRWITRASRSREDLVCLVLAPVLAVAWADRDLSAEERGVILDTAGEFGIVEGTPAFNLMSPWLENRGVMRLADAWVAYVRLLCGDMTTPDRRSLKRTLLKNARRIANGAHPTTLFSPFSWLRRSRALRRLNAAFEDN